MRVEFCGERIRVPEWLIISEISNQYTLKPEFDDNPWEIFTVQICNFINKSC